MERCRREKDAEGPRCLARRMASYIADPHYIAAYVRREFGAGPTVADVRAMQTEHRRKRDSFAKPRMASRTFALDTGDHFRVRGLV